MTNSLETSLKRQGSRGPEKFFRGIAVAPGIAHGEALVHWVEEEEEIPFRKIQPEEMPAEIARFETALIATRAELLELQQRIAASIGAADAGIFDAHLLVVEDRTLIDEVLRTLEKERFNIETCFHRVAERYCKSLSAIDDPYLRERVVDIRDVSRRVIRNLLGKETKAIGASDRTHILVAHDLTPSDTAMLNRELVLGFATEAGSKTSHTAIMARALDIPAVVGISELCRHVASGDDLLIDGYTGTVVLNPSVETLERYGRIEVEREEVEVRLGTLRELPAQTTDGRRITLSANIELADEVDEVLRYGAEGVGLYRTEYLYLNRQRPPDEEEQFGCYARVAERCQPHSVIIRTLDIGGDKSTDCLELPKEQNPFLGCRAIRFCLEHPEIFKTQIRAILRAGAKGNVRMMLPMISGLEELRAAKKIIEECKRELAAAQVEFNPDIELGTMIELPSAALSAQWIAQEVSFFSIGTNDLIQYAIAVDRVNERIAHLYQPAHPAILRLIHMTAEAAHDAGIWCGVCGEMAGDISLIPLLVGLGVDELSTAPSIVPRVKKAVCSLSYLECQALALEALSMGDHSSVFALSDGHARDRYKELF